ncbi:MAG: lysine--tRNA ligase [Candidatus Aenigmarchaeota archaeon]|nr:lysine--tRNA ligase [Candidatus Aenigmarchaeota archaeon]
MEKESLFWADQVAKEVVGSWKVGHYRTEMGIGASGIPHVGSAGDAVRSYVVSLGIKELGKKSELIAFSDDRDGLRKVPSGFPSSLEKEIGKPVSTITDPFGCHKSFALHVSSLLLDAFEKIGISFTLRRGNEEYRKGTFDKEVVEILTKWKKAGEIIKRVTGSEKFLSQLPFLPVCKSCGRVYTTRATGFDAAHKKIAYVCDQEFAGKSKGRDVLIKGCGFQGDAGIREGKLAWKVEFAARWRALDIHYEAYGKDILESVKCNDAICKEILGREPPVHSFYELFTERGGEKLSKSKGNVFTPQMWMRVASPESLRLLFLKRLGTTRVVDLDSIPALMDEVDELGGVYFGDMKIKNERELAHKKRLFEYVHFLQMPEKCGFTVPYQNLVNLVASLPIKEKDAIVQETLKVGKDEEGELKKRVAYATKWAGREKPPQVKIQLDKGEKKALMQLSEVLKKPLSGDEVQNVIFNIAKERGLKPSHFFRLLYKIIIGIDKGPRAGKLITILGREKVRQLIWKRI